MTKPSPPTSTLNSVVQLEMAARGDSVQLETAPPPSAHEILAMSDGFRLETRIRLPRTNAYRVRDTVPVKSREQMRDALGDLCNIRDFRDSLFKTGALLLGQKNVPEAITCLSYQHLERGS